MKETKKEKLKRLLASNFYSFKKRDAALIKGVTRATINNNINYFNLEDGRILNDEDFKNWQPKRKG